jgi:hypothetical protein
MPFFFSRAKSYARRYQSNSNTILHPFLFLLLFVKIPVFCIFLHFFFPLQGKAKGKVPPHKNICEYHFTCYCYQYNFITDQTPLKNNATYCGQTRGRLARVQRRARSVSRDDNFCDEFITNASKKGWNVGGG